jgi:CBS domain containing-hemolysin-like protein
MSSDINQHKAAPSASDDGNSGSPQRWLASLRARFGLAANQTLRETLEDALKTETKTADAFTPEERAIFLRLLRFGPLRVEDVMVPRADIIALDESEPLSELVRTFKEAGVSRIPLFHETLDDLRGIVHIKDAFQWLMAEAAGNPRGEPQAGATGGAAAAAAQRPPGADKRSPSSATPLALGAIDLSRPITVAKIRRPVLYVPPSMPAMNLLIRMQSTRIHMAFVIDEYGGTDGLVTIEDLVEQIVGDIEDEHDETEAAHIINDSKLGLVASARTPVKELEVHLGVKLLKPEEEEEIDTLGGLVFALVSRVPARGELVPHPSGIEFEVLDADPRRVKKLKVHLARGTEAQRPSTSSPMG